MFRCVALLCLTACASGSYLGDETTDDSTATTDPDWTDTPTGDAPYRPFPQQMDHHLGKPSRSQDLLDTDVAVFFDYWKAAYLRESNGNTQGGGYYIEGEGTGYANEKTTSEAHGYGMIVFALMAGRDADAQEIFDGLFNMYDHHRSTGDPDLMSWVISNNENGNQDSNSATDGDMDIAYALLLAHDQWGSNGPINYQGQALRIIEDGIRRSEVDGGSMRTLLGDWDNDPNSSRPSDWMTGHFAAYAETTGDDWWYTLQAETYDNVASLQDNHAPNTGLLPDFVIGDPPRPSGAWFLENENDGSYYWNACRVPWRLATDVAHNDSAEAAAAIQKMADWIVSETNGDPWEIKAGYTLDGQQLNSWGVTAFSAPLIAATAVDSEHQAFLDDGWDLMTEERQGYYEDSINLLTMLLISGNWWAPAQ